MKRSSFLRNQKLGLLLLCGSAFAAGCGPTLGGSGDWVLVYEDDYNYAASVEKFNTWFWREDQTGTHIFNVTNVPQAGCTPNSPCVQLTAPVAPTNTKYINAEMYNNSCAVPTSPEDSATPEAFCDPSVDCTLRSGPWFDYPEGCYMCYVDYCSRAYPYRSGTGRTAPPGVKDSWNTRFTGGIRLWRNPIAIIDSEKNWKGYRDLVFNVPYLANREKSVKVTMGITAEGVAGGSRGWGFWNTTMDPFTFQLAWFMELTKQAPLHPLGQVVDNGFYAMTLGQAPGSGKTGICFSKLAAPELTESVDIYGARSYEIAWLPDSVTYFADGVAVAQHTAYVPNRELSFHNWADNRNYFGKTPPNYPLFTAKTNYINAYKVYHAGSPLTPAAPSGNDPVCLEIPLEQIAKDFEKDLIAGIIAWLIAEGMLPGPPLPPG